ncbi:hypothetical protein KDRO_B01100 [Kluyveromyces lactis]|nr:hypothetical protein KDRO_B01100 [Kluyveromyces lactis]
MDIDWEIAHHELLQFLIYEVKEYLSFDPNSTFYALALDIEFDHLRVSIALNTIAKHEHILKQYYLGEETNSEEKFNIKYNTGDWEGGIFANKFLVDSETFDNFTRVASDEQVEIVNAKFRATAWSVLKEFVETNEYESIPKVRPFVAFVIDHDEEVEDALRLAKEAGTSEL